MWIRLGDKHIKKIVKYTDMTNTWSIIDETLITTHAIHYAVNGDLYDVEIANDIIHDIKKRL